MPPSQIKKKCLQPPNIELLMSSPPPTHTPTSKLVHRDRGGKGGAGEDNALQVTQTIRLNRETSLEIKAFAVEKIIRKYAQDAGNCIIHRTLFSNFTANHVPHPPPPPKRKTNHVTPPQPKKKKAALLCWFSFRMSLPKYFFIKKKSGLDHIWSFIAAFFKNMSTAPPRSQFLRVESCRSSELCCGSTTQKLKLIYVASSTT